MAVSEELLEILVCPACKQRLKLSKAEDALVCTSCRLRYPIEDDIPVLIASAAEPLGAAEPLDPREPLD